MEIVATVSKFKFCSSELSGFYFPKYFWSTVGWIQSMNVESVDMEDWL